MNNIALVLAVLLACAQVSACSWVGRTAGKVSAKVERKTDDLERGYQQGYQEEKGKTPQSSSTPGPAQSD